MKGLNKRIILISTVVFTVLFLLTSFIWSRVAAPASTEDDPVGPPAVSDTGSVSSSVPEPVSVSLFAVGDNLIHGAIFNQAKNRGGSFYDFEFVYENIKDDILAADISMINQETVISDKHEPSHYPRFCTPPEMLEMLEKLGFDAANIATNHVLDKGESGLAAMLELFSESSILTTGAFKNEQDSAAVRSLTRNDITFSFVGVTYGTNGLRLPSGSELVVNLIENEEAVKRQIEAARKVSDFVIVNVHWGNEYTHSPNESQREYAQKLADWGADIIIGHHPHVIQPLETVQTKDGKTVYVMYSLGNFVSAQDSPARVLGAALSFNVTKNYEKNETYISSIEVSPTVTHYTSGFRNIQVYPFEKYSEDMAVSHGLRSKGLSYDYLVETFNRVMGKYSTVYPENNT